MAEDRVQYAPNISQVEASLPTTRELICYPLIASQVDLISYLFNQLCG